MFIYNDFKMNVLSGDFEKAKALLGDIELDAETFNAISNVSMFLSLAFRYPEEDVYDTLKDNWEAFKDFMDDYSDVKPELYDHVEMESDYIKLFEQDMKKNTVVPYISYYTEENKSLYGKSTFNIREWMEEEGFQLDDDTVELEDHIYIVMEFVSAVFKRLAEPENIEQWYVSLKNLYNLLDNYAPVLADEFAAAVAKRDDMSFYRDFAKILAAFLNDIDPILEDVFSEED